MQTASLAQLKKELEQMPQSEMLEHFIQIVKFKKENKELLSYLIYEQSNEKEYIDNCKNEISELFKTVNTINFYWAKKTVRKILRLLTKYAKYSGKPATQIALLIHFCKAMKELNMDLSASASMYLLYANQLVKIEKELLKLHEDLQYDFRLEMGPLGL